MGMRSGTTFKKRQKELARMEKQRDKAARRVQRKAEKLSSCRIDWIRIPGRQFWGLTGTL